MRAAICSSSFLVRLKRAKAARAQTAASAPSPMVLGEFAACSVCARTLPAIDESSVNMIKPLSFSPLPLRGNSLDEPCADTLLGCQAGEMRMNKVVWSPRVR